MKIKKDEVLTEEDLNNLETTLNGPDLYITEEVLQKAFKQNEGNRYRIEANGDSIKTSINGVPAADFTDNDEKAFTPSGFIALQVHSVGGSRDTKEVRWKNIKLTGLD